MSFKRNPSLGWSSEVPGTRWLKADLHLHTIDDPTVALPDGLTGDRTLPGTRSAYAHRFLNAAVEQGVEVLGVTPHAAYSSPGVSAAWDIVELWQSGIQESTGIGYRDLVYAVFPGFEPNFADGNKGIHLIFLFDPSIGKDRYQEAFSGIMGGRSAYDGSRLNRTQKDLPGVFALLDDVKVIGAGNYVTAAAHPLQQNGLLNRPGDYITDLAGGESRPPSYNGTRPLEKISSKTANSDTPINKDALRSITPAMRFAFRLPGRHQQSVSLATAALISKWHLQRLRRCAKRCWHHSLACAFPICEMTMTGSSSATTFPHPAQPDSRPDLGSAR